MRTIQELQGQPVASKMLSVYMDKGLPPLLILHGPDGTGRWSAAETFVTQYLCEVKTACGNCSACIKIHAGSHSDIIQFPEDKVSIGNPDKPELFTIRWLLRKKIRYTPFDGDIRFIIFPRADLIQHEAETALLKTLEEPPEHTRFIFITPELSSLKPTVISRGVLIPFQRLSHKTIAQLTQSSLENNDLDYLGGSLHFLPLLQSEFSKRLHEKIDEAMRHPLSMIDLENWIMSSLKSGFSEFDKSADYNDLDLLDFFGLQLMVSTQTHPKSFLIAQSIMEFKKNLHRHMSGLPVYLLGQLFHTLNTTIHVEK